MKPRPPSPKQLSDPAAAYDYAANTLKGRWPEGEQVITEDPYWAALYAGRILKSRWLEVEDVIGRNAAAAYAYATEVIDGPWEPGEDAIAEAPFVARHYAEHVIKGSWPRCHASLVSSPVDAALYATHVIKRFCYPEVKSDEFNYLLDSPELEDAIAGHPEAACLYANGVLGGRWPRAEKVIARDAKSALLYVSGVVKGRWPEGEAAIAASAPDSSRYAETMKRFGTSLPKNWRDEAKEAAKQAKEELVASSFCRLTMVVGHDDIEAAHQKAEAEGQWQYFVPSILVAEVGNKDGSKFYGVESGAAFFRPEAGHPKPMAWTEETFQDIRRMRAEAGFAEPGDDCPDGWELAHDVHALFCAMSSDDRRIADRAFFNSPPDGWEIEPEDLTDCVDTEDPVGGARVLVAAFSQPDWIVHNPGPSTTLLGRQCWGKQPEHEPCSSEVALEQETQAKLACMEAMPMLAAYKQRRSAVKV